MLADDATDAPGMTAQLVSGPTNGTLGLASDGSFTYAPAAAFVGSDSFTYNAVLPDGTTSPATVTIDVTKSPPATIAGSLSDAAGQTASVTIASLLSGASDNGGVIDPATLLIVSPPSHGSAVIGTVNGQAGVIYTPDAGFHGSDSFYYTVSDNTGQTSNASQVTVAVAAPDSVAAPDAASAGAQDAPQTIDVLSGVTINGQPAAGMSGVSVTLSGTAVGNAGGAVGTVSLNANNQAVFTPASGWSGDGSFTYTVTDAAGTQATGTVNVRATAVDAPVGADMTVSGVENQGTQFSLPKSWQYVEVTTPPAHGTLTNYANGTFNFVPDGNYSGDDSFDYAAYDSDWNKVTGTVTLDVAAGTDLPPDPTGPGDPPTFDEQPVDAPYDLVVEIAAFSSFTTEDGGVTIENWSAVPIDASFLPDNEVDLWPIFPSDTYSTNVITNGGYENAKWTGPYGQNFTFNVDGSILGDLAGSANFYLNAYDTIGSVMGADVYASAPFGVGSVIASGNVGVATGGVLPSIVARGNIYWAVGDGGITGPIIAGGSIGEVSSMRDVGGPIFAYGDIGAIGARNLTGNVISLTGDIGFGLGPDWPGWVNTPWYTGSYVDSGVGVLKSLSGSITAVKGDIQIVRAKEITSPSIFAGGSIQMVMARDALTGTSIRANGGDLGSVSVGLGGISGATIYAQDEIGGAGQEATYDLEEANGGLSGAYSSLDILATDGVGSQGAISGASIKSEGDIEWVYAVHSISADINADDDINTVAAGDSIFSTIKAGGNIGTIDTKDQVVYGVHAGGLAQDVSGTITAGGDINRINVGRDLTATVKAVNLPDVSFDAVTVGRDDNGKITATGAIGTIWVGRNLTQPVSGNSIFTVSAGNDIASAAKIDSKKTIGAVYAGHTLAGDVIAGGDLGLVYAGSYGIGNYGWANPATSAGTISSGTISSGGSITQVGAFGGPGLAGDISGTNITAAGSIGTVSATHNLNATIHAGTTISVVQAGQSANLFSPGANGGDLSGTITAGTSITGSVAAISSPFDPTLGSISATVSAGYDIGNVTASLDVGGDVTAGHSVVRPVTAGRDISGALTATSGDIYAATAGNDISGSLTAGRDIGPVSADRDISGNITAGAVADDGAGEGESGGGGDGEDGEGGPPSVTPGVGGIYSVTAGLGPSGGSISGNLTAGAAIGPVKAWGPTDLRDISTLVTPAGLIGTGAEWWLTIDPVTNTYTVQKPAGEPAAESGGNISGSIDAGTTIGFVTAYGSISGSIDAGQTIAPVWALGDISGGITAGAGNLLVNSWGAVSGALDAAGDITTSAFNDISGAVTSLGKVVLNAWGSITSAVDAKYNAALWALGNIASSSVVSRVGQAAFTAFGSITGVVSQGQAFFVHFAANIEGCTFTSDLTAPATGASFAPGTVLLYVWGSITGSTIDVAHLVGSGDLPNPFGYVSIIAGGDVTGTTIKASIGVDLLANGSATSDTIDTSAGAAIQSALRQAGGFANWVAGDISFLSLIGPFGKERLALKLFGALVDGLSNQVGYVNVMAEKSADATVTSPSWIQVASLHVSGNYTADEVDIDAWNGASLGNVEGHNDANIFVHGALSGTVDSDNGTVEIETSGDVSATVTGKWSVAVKTQGGCTGGSITSASGPVAVDAYGDVSDPISAPVYVDVRSWTGAISGAITTSGYAKLDAGGDSSANVSAGGNVVIVSLGNVSGTIAAGNGSYIPNDGDPPNIQQTWSADIDAEGNAGGEITAPGEVSVESNGNITSQVTSQYSTVELDAAGQVGSITVQGAGDVTLLGAEGINVGDVTSENGALYVRSGNELILSGGGAATTATVISAGVATATVAMSNSAGMVTITGLGNVTATVNGACAAVSVSSGGNATVSVQGADGGPGTVNVVSMGGMSGGIQQAGAINLTGWGGVNLTADALNSLAIVSGAALQGTYTSGGSLSAEALGAVTGSYSAADGGVSVVGKTSVDGQITDTTAGSATVASLGNVGASVTTTAGDISVNSGGGVTGPINSGRDANVSALNGAISGAVKAGSTANLLASQGVTSTVLAGQNVSLVSFGAVTNSVTATAGSATLNVYAALSGPVQAGGAASVCADQAAGSTITAGGDATVTSKNTITSTVTAGGNANVSSVQGVQGDIQATGSATVLGIQDVSANVTTNSGGITINCGGTLSSTVQAGGDASVVSLGDVEGDITANGGAAVTGWSDIDGDVTAKTGGVTLYVNGSLVGAANAGTSASATVVGDVTGDITAGGAVTVSVGGEQAGAIDAGGDVSVTSGGQCSGAIGAAGDASVESLGDITSAVVAGGDISLDTWSNITTDTVHAGGGASLSADGNLQVTVTADTGAIDAETLGTAQVDATAQGDVTFDALGAVSRTTLTSNAGSVDVEAYDDAAITVQADQDASLLVNGNLDGDVTTTDGDIDVESLGALTGTYTAGGGAEVESLDDATGAGVSAAGNADLTTFAAANNVSVSGVLGASAWSGLAFSGTVTSTQGEVDVSSIGDMTVTANAAADASVESLGAGQVDVTSGGDSNVVALGNLSGPVNAGNDALLFSGGDLGANVTAGRDATVEAVGNLSGDAHAQRNLGAAAFGYLDAENFHAVGDVTLIWARGDITGDISADGAIDDVEGYGAVNASFTAPNIGTVAAFGPIGGSLNASVAIGSVASGSSITATLNSPSVGGVSPYQHGLLADWPQPPDVSDAADIELSDEDRAALESLSAQMSALKSAVLAELPADKAAAAPSYQISIGDIAAVTAWFENTAMQLAAQIAAAQESGFKLGAHG